MPNIFLQQSDLTSHTSAVRAVKLLADGNYAIALEQNIVRPEGGGQPQDRASIIFGNTTVPIGKVFKSGGETWLTLTSLQGDAPEIGELALIEVDAAHRWELSRSHSLSHVLMAATRHVTESFNSKGASLSEEGGLVNIRFHTSTKLEPTIIDTIDCLTRHLVAKNARIETLTVKSLASAERSFRHWRVDPELGLSGKIRVVNIAGIDANPCGGSHVKSTDEIGPFAIKGYRAEGAGTYTIEAARVPVWMDWYDDEFLARSALVDLRVFEP